MENGLSKSVARLAAISGNPPLMEGAIRSASHMTGTIPTMDKIMAVCLSLSRSLNDEKTKLMEEGKSADAVDDLLVKVGNAPLKKFKVIERKRSDEAR